MNEGHFFNIGTMQIWGGSRPFGFSRNDLARHAFIVGQTGVGKSTAIRNLAIQIIESGGSMALIDPHGDLCDELLDHFPPRRSDHLIYFNPADVDHPVGLNLLAHVANDHDRPRVASSAVSALRAIWSHSWGPRLEWLLYSSIAALLECRNVTVLGIPRMLTDEAYRTWVLRQVKDPIIRSFWNEFDSWDDRFRNEAISPAQNKLGQLLAAAPLRNVLGQVQNRVDARFIMDNGRVFIANLSRGRLGEDKANLLGALLVAQFHSAAMSRSIIPEGQRRDFVMICDEFAGYTNEVLARSLSELRKYRMSLVLATQYLGQVPQPVWEAISGNCGSMVSFRVGEADAEIMSREFGGAYSAAAFRDLSNFEVLMKMTSAGSAIEPFRGKTDPPLGRRHDRRDNLIQHSRQRYSTPRSRVEERIRRWMRQ